MKKKRLELTKQELEMIAAALIRHLNNAPLTGEEVKEIETLLETLRMKLIDLYEQEDKAE